MIPHIIHQTWKTDEIPERFQGWCATWRDRNPGWDYRLWTDRDLLEFVAAHYPAHLETFCGYRHGVQRADAARYMLLHCFGGFYADIDTQCQRSLEPLASDDRIILCQEPEVHWAPAIPYRGLPMLIFNGIMASPAGHPFWPHLLARMEDVREASDVLDSTGPCLLTASVLSYPAQEAIRVDAARLFNPADVFGRSEYHPNDPDCYALHHWAGTWWRGNEHPSWLRRKSSSVAKRIYRAKAWLTGGARLDPQRAQAAVSAEAIARPLPAGGNIAVMVPVRDASQHIAAFLAAIGRLDVPKERLKLVFCEGDSRDGSFERLQQQTAILKPLYRDIVLLRKDVGTRFDRAKRWLPSLQRARRAGLASVRNHLIDHGLDETDDWALWIDIDVWRFPPDIVARLIGAKAKIVTPNCVSRPGGQSFDLNSFTTRTVKRNYKYYRMVKGGLFQPPVDYGGRLKLSDLRHSDRVPLDSVGGTMLLVDAALHRGGLRFPELPYDDLIETEGFGRLARDCGVTPIGLPRVEIMHVPW